jgi:hypothetical protein
VSIREHTSAAYDSIRQGVANCSSTDAASSRATPAYVSIRQYTSAAYVSIRQDAANCSATEAASSRATPAYVRIRQHTSAAYVSMRQDVANCSATEATSSRATLPRQKKGGGSILRLYINALYYQGSIKALLKLY